MWPPNVVTLLLSHDTVSVLWQLNYSRKMQHFKMYKPTYVTQKAAPSSYVTGVYPLDSDEAPYN